MSISVALYQSHLTPSLATISGESAESHLISTTPTVTAQDTVASVISRLKNCALNEVVCLVDGAGVFVGLIPVSRLLVSAGDTPVSVLAELNVPTVRSGTDQEAVATIALDHQLLAVPVVDAEQRFLGVVPVQALLNILRREHIEDLHRLAGIKKNGEMAKSALDGPLMHRIASRLPWLLVGLVGSMVATGLMMSFEQTLQTQLTVAFFVPAVVYLADAIGNQSEAVAVRGLSLSDARITSLLRGELLTGAAVGLALAVIIFPAVWFVFGDPKLGFAVASAVVVSGSAASTIGLLLPWIISRLGMDPAFGSGPLATILQDLLSILTYLSIVSALVVG